MAVVGAGPGGFYTTKYLLRDAPGCTVDLYDRLPTPYGLVRSGVAPDHQDVKAVQNDFAEVARDAEHRFNFYGNVTVGGENDAGDVSVEELRKRYNAVVMCYGASADRALGLPRGPRACSALCCQLAQQPPSMQNMAVWVLNRVMDRVMWCRLCTGPDCKPGKASG